MFGQKMTGEDAPQEVLDAGVKRFIGRQGARDAADAFADLTGQIRHDTCWRREAIDGAVEEVQLENRWFSWRKEEVEKSERNISERA